MAEPFSKRFITAKVRFTILYFTILSFYFTFKFYFFNSFFTNLKQRLDTNLIRFLNYSLIIKILRIDPIEIIFIRIGILFNFLLFTNFDTILIFKYYFTL